MLSIVVPVFNEEESLGFFYKELVKELKKLDHNYEIIFIDDGSTDHSLDTLKNFADKNKNVRAFSFRRNQGKAEALTLGFQKAKGDYIVTLDADLQDQPSEIEKLLKKIKEGWDLVSGWRSDRKDSSSKVISSKFFNFMASFFWGLKLHDYNCGLKIYRREATRNLNLYGGFHRFIPLLVYQQGFRVTEVSVSHSPRKYGKSKYGISRLWKDLPDMFTMLFLSKYSQRPLHFFGIVGLILFFLGILILGYLSILHFQGHAIGRRPLLFFGMLLILSGLQVLFTGFLADLFLHISQNGNNKESSIKYGTR